MGKHTYTVSIHIGRGSTSDNHYFKRLKLKSADYDDYEEFCQALASEVLEQIKQDIEYREAVRGV